jgi:hypothetical protein
MYRAFSAVFTDDGEFRGSVGANRDRMLEMSNLARKNGWGEISPRAFAGYDATTSYDAGAVSCLNQMLSLFSKIRGGHTPESEVRAYATFLEREKEIASTDLPLEAIVPGTCKTLASILYYASMKVRRVLSRVDPRQIRPAHGSGVSACGTKIRDRYRTPRFVESIDRVWAYTDYYFLDMEHVCSCLEEVYSMEDYVPVAKTILVPKDAKGPRLISCEPKETMWIQQGLMTALYTAIESHPMTRRSVNFTDQRHNQAAALRASKDKRHATLDLSEASDRLRLDVVEMLFPPNWRQALLACRSGSTMFPDGTVVPLAKHAPMGSAVCFPVMALSIWAVLAATLPQNCKILVYGDDIIVPTKYAELACEVLERIGLKVNVTKSYVAGPFRESCGIEAISGLDITPVRLRAIPADNSDSRARTIAFANNMFAKHGKELSWLTKLIHEWYDDVPERSHNPHTGEVIAIERLDGALLHSVSSVTITNKTLCGVLNVWDADNSHLRCRWNSKLQRKEYRYLHVEPLEIKYSTDDWCHLFRALVNPRARKAFGVDALSKRVRYKYRWASLV